MRYAIIEDNHFAREHLRILISKIRPDWELAFIGTSVASTVMYLKDSPDIDLMFMDIELSDGRCFAIFEQTGTTVPVIFTTAYDEFAIQAFKVNSLGYILKPVNENELNHAIDKYEYLRTQVMNGGHKDDSNIQSRDVAATSIQRILISSGDKYTYIHLDDISYFTSEDNYVFAFLKNGSSHLITIKNLSSLDEMLPADRFFRLSRNVIASIESISSVSKYHRGRLKVVVCAGDSTIEIMVSAERRDYFLNWFGQG